MRSIKTCLGIAVAALYFGLGFANCNSDIQNIHQNNGLCGGIIYENKNERYVYTDTGYLGIDEGKDGSYDKIMNYLTVPLQLDGKMADKAKSDLDQVVNCNLGEKK